MKLELARLSAHGQWSGHGEYEHKVDPELKPCPFCGIYLIDGDELQAQNTHNPYYSVSCNNCGAEGPTSSGGYDGGRTGHMSRLTIETFHRDAFADAIRLWNEASRRKKSGQ